MKLPGQRETDAPLPPPPAVAPTGAAPAEVGEQVTRINLGSHSAGSAAATIRKVAELLGYGIVASGPASFRLTRPVRRGIRRVDEVVNVSLHNGTDGLSVEHDGHLDPRLIEQLEAQARLEEPKPPPPQAAPVANLPKSNGTHAHRIEVRPGVVPQGLIDSVPGSAPKPPPPKFTVRPPLVIHLPGGPAISGEGGVVIGREPDRSLRPDCRTALTVDDPGISKTHVAVWLDGDAIVIEDLHSTNGSEWELDGQKHRCEAGKPTPVVAPMVHLVVGTARILLEKTR